MDKRGGAGLYAVELHGGHTAHAYEHSHAGTDFAMPQYLQHFKFVASTPAVLHVVSMASPWRL